ncbi:MAG: hypothetical protein K9L68_03665 [Spirochaetales bacterium]|nr:hypothetical protein [Spirochaetales bacterium]
MVFIILGVFFLAAPGYLHSYKITYAEQYYRLFHLHFYQYPNDLMENIHYLERALRSDFANPLNALARIETEKEWERYRALFYMHVNIKLVELHLRLGSKFDRQNAYFYQYPWKYANLQSLEKAESIYRYALGYWEEALEWADKVPYAPYMNLEEIQNWEDEHYRVENGDLDYQDIIERHLERLQSVREKYEAMGPDTY